KAQSLSSPHRYCCPRCMARVKVDVLAVRQIKIDQLSDDPGERLHASAHAWATDCATEVTIAVASSSGSPVEVSTLVAEPGPLIPMKPGCWPPATGCRSGSPAARSPAPERKSATGRGCRFPGPRPCPPPPPPGRR